MAETRLHIAGRLYRIDCRDGDEPRVAALGADLAARAEALTAALGAVGEGQLLVMLALMLADELAEARAGIAPPVPDTAALAALVARVEALAANISAPPA
jgi:cell division protein ZapA